MMLFKEKLHILLAYSISKIIYFTVYTYFDIQVMSRMNIFVATGLTSQHCYQFYPQVF